MNCIVFIGLLEYATYVVITKVAPHILNLFHENRLCISIMYDLQEPLSGLPDIVILVWTLVTFSFLEIPR